MKKVAKIINKLFQKTTGYKIVRANKIKTKKHKQYVGLIDEFTEKGISGWVNTKNKKITTVELFINEHPVHSTVALLPKKKYAKNGNIKGFYIGIQGIWKYSKKTDRLTVRVNNQMLPIVNNGVYYKPKQDGESSVDNLLKLLSKGYLFTKLGDLELSKVIDKEWQMQVFYLHDLVVDILNKHYKITPFIIYGSLLGYVRDGDFLPNDDDIDLGYISKHKDGKKAADELLEIAKKLSKHKELYIELRRTAIHIHSAVDHRYKIDLFHLIFDENNELGFPYGVAGSTNFHKNDWFGTEKIELSGHTVNSPKNPIKLTEYIYGPTWKVPTKGFDWNKSRTKRAKSAILPKDYIDLIK